MHCATLEVVVHPPKTRHATIIRERSVLTRNFDLASTSIGTSFIHNDWEGWSRRPLLQLFTPALVEHHLKCHKWRLIWRNKLWPPRVWRNSMNSSSSSGRQPPSSVVTSKGGPSASSTAHAHRQLQLEAIQLKSFVKNVKIQEVWPNFDHPPPDQGGPEGTPPSSTYPWH